MDFKIQYVSDIHLEFHDKYNEGQITPSMFLKPSAPYLALCGDIGIPELKAYEKFLQWCSEEYEKVFIVAGNHEYYTYRCPIKNDIPTKQKKIFEITKKFSNIYFLDCSSYFFEKFNLRILGCTLWSNVSEGDERLIIKSMNDSRNIYIEGINSLLPRKMTELHFEQKSWLAQEIQAAAEKKETLLILTHYLPSYKLIAAKYADNPLNMCFASDCEDLLKQPVKAWICGHSHTGVTKEINGVKLCMNPYGYTGERVETRDRAKILELLV
jgi:3',5'-cyclic AMP phosphodiesterase CpdA